MRETGFFTGLCCWAGAQSADSGNSVQTVQQAQSQSARASVGEVTGASADSEPLLQSPSRGPMSTGLSVLDSASTGGLSNRRKTSRGDHGRADVPLKSILKKPCEKLSCEEPWHTSESVDTDGRGNKEVSFDPMMKVYRIEPRDASMKVKQISSHTRANRHMLKSEAREDQTSEVKVNAKKNSAINEQGSQLRKLLRSKASVRTGVARGRPCLASKRSLVRPESGSSNTPRPIVP